MRRPIKLYVSTGRDLHREQDAIGRVVAELPVTAGWEIGATPLGGPANAPVAALASPIKCDLFIFVLGQDITAPAGSEWDAAYRAGVPGLALLKDVARTPAGQEFQRYGQDRWVRFRSLEQLEWEVRAWLVKRLLERADALRLTLPEIEQLAALAAEQPVEQTQIAPPDHEGGAGGSGIILSSPPGGA